MENHLGPVGLGHKVRGAVGKGCHLVLLAAALGHDDHGNQGQLRLPPELVQKGIAIHHGHHDVQKNEGYAVPALAENVQRFLAVSGLQYTVLLRQNLAQHGTVQLVVLHNKNVLARHHTQLLLSGAADPRIISSQPRKLFDFSLYITFS